MSNGHLDPRVAEVLEARMVRCGACSGKYRVGTDCPECHRVEAETEARKAAVREAKRAKLAAGGGEHTTPAELDLIARPVDSARTRERTEAREASPPPPPEAPDARTGTPCPDCGRPRNPANNRCYACRPGGAKGTARKAGKPARLTRCPACAGKLNSFTNRCPRCEKAAPEPADLVPVWVRPTTPAPRPAAPPAVAAAAVTGAGVDPELAAIAAVLALDPAAARRVAAYLSLRLGGEGGAV